MIKVALFILSLGFTLSSFADDIRVIRLEKHDSSKFRKVISGFSNPETILDPNNPSIWHIANKYQSKNESLTMFCLTEIIEGAEGISECRAEFNLSKSSTELEVYEGKIAGAIVAQFNDSYLATQINGNIGYMPFITFEKVNIKLPAGGIQPTPRIRIDCEKIQNSGGMAKSCTLVAIPNQKN